MGPANCFILVLLLLNVLPDGLTVRIIMGENQTANVGDTEILIHCEYTEPVVDSETTLRTSYIEWERVSLDGSSEEEILVQIFNGEIYVEKPDKYGITESTLPEKQPSLLIYNVELSDEAVYYCKTNFVLDGQSGASQEGDSQSIILTVHKPPTHVDIIGYDSREAIGLNSSGKITVECRAYNSKPAALLKWYIGEREIVENIRNSTRENGEGTITTSSYLVYYPTAMDNDNILKCVCDTETAKTNHHLTDEVTISVVEKLVGSGQDKTQSNTFVSLLLILFVVFHFL
ncbi:CD276 antigen homolog [Ptychodera flava]|uniref:CD276 antigen homolog n=1 Tax=Ptychodera flava TaxID=63121 RepID=UPI00396A9BBA